MVYNANGILNHNNLLQTAEKVCLNIDRDIRLAQRITFSFRLLFTTYWKLLNDVSDLP